MLSPGGALSKSSGRHFFPKNDLLYVGEGSSGACCSAILTSGSERRLSPEKISLKRSTVPIAHCLESKNSGAGGDFSHSSLYIPILCFRAISVNNSLVGSS